MPTVLDQVAMSICHVHQGSFLLNIQREDLFCEMNYRSCGPGTVDLGFICVPHKQWGALLFFRKIHLGALG